MTQTDLNLPQPDFMLRGDGVSNGSISVRLARNYDEIRAAQRLRYQVFYEENGASPTGVGRDVGYDIDAFDDVADHLIVLDSARTDFPVVGTYRLIREPAAKTIGHFYTAGEFGIAAMEKLGRGSLLELGRSCVHIDYRNRNTLQLLWQGIAEYVAWHRIKFLFGCASFHGTEPDAIADCLSFLYHNHRAPDAYCPTTQLTDPRRVDMNRIPNDQIDARDVLNKLPPLIKGYLRVGAFVGDGAIIDTQFNTIDVCIVVETALLPERYRRHYDKRVVNFSDAITSELANP